MKKIEDKNTLDKYLSYLIDFADDLLEKIDLNSADLNQLKRENEVVHERLSTQYLSHKLIQEIIDIKLKGSIPEDGVNFFKMFFSQRSTRYGRSIDDGGKHTVEEYREQIIVYKQRLTNLVMNLGNYTFYK